MTETLALPFTGRKGVHFWLVLDHGTLAVLTGRQALRHLRQQYRCTWQQASGRLAEAEETARKEADETAGPDRRGSTVSEGTLRQSDLLTAFLDALREMAPRRFLAVVLRAIEEGWPYDEHGLAIGEMTDADDTLLTTADWLIEIASDALDEASPAGCSFGSHEGDGALFGFWPNETDDTGG